MDIEMKMTVIDARKLRGLLGVMTGAVEFKSKWFALTERINTAFPELDDESGFAKIDKEEKRNVMLFEREQTAVLNGLITINKLPESNGYDYINCVAMAKVMRLKGAFSKMAEQKEVPIHAGEIDDLNLEPDAEVAEVAEAVPTPTPDTEAF